MGIAFIPPVPLGQQVPYFDKRDPSVPIVEPTRLKAITQVIKRIMASISPGLRFAANFVAQGLTTGYTSKMFEAKVVYASSELSHLWLKSYFGEDLMGKACNIGQREVLTNHKDYEASVRLLNKMKSFDARSPAKVQEVFKNVSAKSERELESTLTDGICNGIRLDIAYRYLIGKETVEEIVKSNEAGASAEAAANQAVYSLIQFTPKLSFSLKDLFCRLHEMSQSKGGHELFHTDFVQVFQALEITDTELLGKDFDSLNEKIERAQGSPASVQTPFLNIVEKLVIDERAHIRELDRNHSLKDYSGWLQRVEQPRLQFIVKDPLAFKAAMSQEIHQHYVAIESQTVEELEQLQSRQKADLRQLEWLVGLLQYRKGLQEAHEQKQTQKEKENMLNAAPLTTKLAYEIDQFWKALREKAAALFGVKEADVREPWYRYVFHPLIKHALMKLELDRCESVRSQTVAFARGLELQPVHAVMGSSVMHGGDQAYLENLPQLEPGFYAINFDVGDGAHAITYIKESNEKSYLLDPNGFPLKGHDPVYTLQQYQKVLSFYKEAGNQGPLSLKGVPNHNLIIQKVTVLA